MISKLCVKNESSKLETVVVGIADDWGPNPLPEEAVDPKSREHLINDTYPIESDVKLASFPKPPSGLFFFFVFLFLPIFLKNTFQQNFIILTRKD